MNVNEFTAAVDARVRSTREEAVLDDAIRASSPRIVSPLMRGVYLSLAAVSLALGVVGIMLPGLPTTPFLLLTSWLLVRSWPSLNERMLRTRLVGSVLRDWQERRGVRPGVKRTAFLAVGGIVGMSITFGNLPPLSTAAMVALALIGLTVVAALPTVADETA